MKKNVILLLEYNLGDYSEMEDDGYEIPINPNDEGLNESFYQSDALI